MSDNNKTTKVVLSNAAGEAEFDVPSGTTLADFLKERKVDIDANLIEVTADGATDAVLDASEFVIGSDQVVKVELTEERDNG